MQRREFLLSTLALGTLAGVNLPVHAIDPIARKGGPNLKPSIAAYSYRDYLTGKKKPNMSLEDFVDLAAGDEPAGGGAHELLFQRHQHRLPGQTEGPMQQAGAGCQRRCGGQQVYRI